MFYSHTFLARKGPLGTVWCAAHLQHKLKKSHYISTNVEKTVKLIMSPEVPIALRMSGHLLLGVVRIYSKQVDYLYEDCNETRITINRIFTTVSLNLPDDATHAPVHSITLPQKFNLDAMELDDYEWGEDSHMKNNDDITLTEQIPTDREPYIVFSIDEHNWSDFPNVENDSGSGPVPMEEDFPSTGLEKRGPGSEHPSPSNEKGRDDNNDWNGSVEHGRNAQHGFDFINNSPRLPDRVEPDPVVVELVNKDNEFATPSSKVNKDNELATPSSKQADLPEEKHSSGHKDANIEFTGGSFEMEIPPSPDVVHHSPEQEIRPSPAVEQPKPRRNRKRKLYDESTVLTNRFMKDALNDTSNIRRVKRNCPLSSLAIWKQNNRVKLRKEGLFVEPFLTGISSDLLGIYKEDSVKHHLVSTEAPQQETNVAQSPLSGHGNDAEVEIGNDTEVEIQRNNAYASPVRVIPEPTTTVPSPSRGSCFTPGNSNDKVENTEIPEDEISPTAHGASVNPDSEMRTPNTSYEKGMHDDSGYFSDIPELVASPGELGFLEQDDNSPARSQGTPATGDFSKNQRTMEMSSRTRAVAQYLEKQSVTPGTGNSGGGGPEELSLNKILEGKTRKVCARMFYETLVLKNHGLVDAQQQHPYGDITLKVTPKLSKGNFPA